MQGKVEISGVNTAKLKTLSNEEMMHLIELAQAGDEQAKQKLVEGNLKLVLSVIQRFMGRGENPDDLFQVGCIGLLKAIANFDTSKQVRFSTYGVPMIAVSSAGICATTPHPRQPFGARYRLPGSAVQAGAGRKERARADDGGNCPRDGRSAGRGRRARWTRLPLRCLFMSRSTPTAETR